MIFIDSVQLFMYSEFALCRILEQNYCRI